MKIALACQSVLLEKSLEKFLKNYIYPYKQCDFVISDRKIEIDKPLFYLSTEESDLNIPFSKSSLLLSLEKFYDLNFTSSNTKEDTIQATKDFSNLEENISKLTDDFRSDLINLIKEHYE